MTHHTWRKATVRLTIRGAKLRLTIHDAKLTIHGAKLRLTIHEDAEDDDGYELDGKQPIIDGEDEGKDERGQEDQPQRVGGNVEQPVSEFVPHLPLTEERNEADQAANGEEE